MGEATATQPSPPAPSRSWRRPIGRTGRSASWGSASTTWRTRRSWTSSARRERPVNATSTPPSTLSSAASARAWSGAVHRTPSCATSTGATRISASHEGCAEPPGGPRPVGAALLLLAGAVASIVTIVIGVVQVLDDVGVEVGAGVVQYPGDQLDPLRRPEEHRCQLGLGGLATGLTAERHSRHLEQAGVLDQLGGLGNRGFVLLDEVVEMEVDDPADVGDEPGGGALALDVLLDRHQRSQRPLLEEVEDLHAAVAVGHCLGEDRPQRVLDQGGVSVLIASAGGGDQSLHSLLRELGTRTHLGREGIELGVVIRHAHDGGQHPTGREDLPMTRAQTPADALRANWAAKCSTARHTSRRAAPALARSTARPVRPLPTE